MTTIDPPVCVALDVADRSAAAELVAGLAPHVGWFKVGFELFSAAGPAAVADVRERSARVFLDLKVGDIPHTAAAATRQAHLAGADLLTIHGWGGRDMIRACVEVSGELGGPKLLVVTVLTSLDDASLHEIGVPRTTREQAMRIGELAAECGAHGLILSPRELGVIRPAFPHLLLVTPGVRPDDATTDDHARSTTPREAILAGADLLVIGRPITGAADPASAAERVVAEARTALVETQPAGRPKHARQIGDDIEYAEER